MSYLKHKIRKFLESVHQLVIWFPVIWRTRDFDYMYLVEVLTFKTRQLYKFLSSDRVTGSQTSTDIDALKRCLEILENIENDQYVTDGHEEHYRKFPPSTSMEHFFTQTEDGKLLSLPPMEGEERTSFLEANKKTEELYKSLTKEFGKLFFKHLRSWWD